MLITVSNLVVPIGVLLAERTLYIAVFAIALGVALAIERIGEHPQMAFEIGTHSERGDLPAVQCAHGRTAAFLEHD